MRLYRDERDYYAQTITVDPPLVGTWEASFDDGANWVEGTSPASGKWAWLIAGPDFDADAVGLDPAATQATITEDRTVPLLRIKDAPVLAETEGLTITLDSR